MGLNSSFGEVNLDALDATIADTAVDIFIYDTSKDSDGGKWRKRTKKTSWYNETLNTATRGSRKEFPAVAVIVSTTTNVTIYDGDDPDLPMWMVFDGSSGWINDATPVFLSAKNGILAAGGSVINQRLRLVFFLKDHCEDYATPNSGGGHRASVGNFLYRNSQSSVGRTIDSTIGIVNRTINGVAMTVLPNAPIDDTTGLPIPTIAVATDGGLSVIKDDGNVYDVTHGSWNKPIQTFFTEDNLLAYLAANTVNQTYGFHYIEIPSGDFSNGTDGREVGTYDVRFYNSDGRNYIPSLGVKAYGHSFIDGAIGYSGACPSCGLTLLEKNAPRDYENSSIAFVHTDYNTGWMHGDCKGAFLSDTTAETMNRSSATELVTNGTSWTGASGTTAPNGWTNWGYAESTFTIDGGTLRIGNGAANNPTAMHQNITTVVGQVYTFYFSYQVTNAQYAIIRVGTQNLSGNLGYIYGTVSGAQTSDTLTFVATSTTTNISVQLQATSGNSTINIDNFSVKAVGDTDRSVNNNGLAVYGTITKSAVATGADLVAYSGFSTGDNSNHLKQPYNSDLAPGTSPYSVTCWVKTGTSTNDQYIFDRNGGGPGSRNLLLIMHSNSSGSSANKFQFWHRDNFGNVTDIQITDKTITDNVWHQVVALNDGSTYKVYVDGEVSSVTSSQIRNVISDNNPPMFIGIRHSQAHAMQGSMALFRYSLSAPSAEQIKKIYEDEKCLFQENAACTLYGSSDAVTALTYDDKTNLLHVGTSSGRSDFRKLRRINNTTTGITTAISASKGLIAEQ